MADIPLVQVAYHSLREKLLNAEFQVGVLLSESQLAQQLNMSRTPIRDAIRLLESEGLVETLNKKGIRVNKINTNELYDMFDLLIALYLFAFDRIQQYEYEVDLETMESHYQELIEASEQKQFRTYYEAGLLIMRTLLESIQNQVILKTFDLYKDKILFYVVSSRSSNPTRPFTGKKSYRGLIDCLKQKDYDGARGEIIQSKLSVRDEMVRAHRSSPVS